MTADEDVGLPDDDSLKPPKTGGVKTDSKSWARYAYIGPHLIISTLIGGYMGYWIDQWLGTDQIFLLIFGLLGSAAGILNLFRELKSMNREADEEDQRHRG